MMTPIKTVLFAVFLMTGAALASAETPPEKPAADETAPRLALYQSQAGGTKMAYVDMARLFNESPGTEAGIKILQKEMDVKMAERQRLTEELIRLKSESGEAEAIQDLTEKIQLYDQQVEAALDARQAEVFTPVFDTIEGSVKSFGAKQGYSAIYVEPREGARDVTDQVLKELK